MSTARTDRAEGLRVAVVGGGPAGLATALGLARSGARVRLFERSPALGEVGAGLQISPNGARALAFLGLGDRLARIGVPSRAVVPTDGLTGRPVTRFDLTGQTPPYRFLSRPALVAALAEACEAAGVDIDLGVESPDVDADLIVGADGIRSGMRAALNGAASANFSGQVAWRAIIRAEAAAEARIWMLPGRHVVSYPLPDGRLNLVAVQERTGWAAESWSAPGDPDTLRTSFADACSPLGALLEKVEETSLWGLFLHPVAARWHDVTRVLVGDAAHPTLPFLAQGANLALEDAVVLSRCVAQGGLAGLPRYQSARQARVTRAIAAARANAANYHLAGVRRRVAFAGLAGIGRLAPDAFLRRLAWLYDYDPSTAAL